MRKDQPYISENTRWSFFGAVPRIRRVRGGAVAPGGSVFYEKDQSGSGGPSNRGRQDMGPDDFPIGQDYRERFILALIEDLTSEKKEIHVKEKLTRDLERRVEERAEAIQRVRQHIETFWKP